MVKQPTNPKEYALRLLKIRDRSIGEMRRRMRDRGFLNDEITSTIEYLIGVHFLDDRRFAEQYVRAERRRKAQGSAMIRAKLQQFEIPEAIIAEVLAVESDEAEYTSARQAADKWLKTKITLSDQEKKEKLARFLGGRGFQWYSINRVLNDLNFR